MARVHAVFADAEGVRRALEQLASEGVDTGAIEVRSSAPLHGVDLPGSVPRFRTPLLAVFGAVLGGIATYLLATRTPPIGNLEAATGPPIAVIVFEGMAVGAILLTVANVFRECGLPAFSHRAGPFDAQLAEGKIVVSVRDEDDGPLGWAEEAELTQRSVRPPPG